MNKEEMRIAVAKAAGWKPCPKEGCLAHWTKPKTKKQQDLPPLTLDWLHEVEKALTPSEWPHYIHNLQKVTRSGGFSIMWRNYATCIHATAEQRAEAFLKVKGLWRLDE